MKLLTYNIYPFTLYQLYSTHQSYILFMLTYIIIKQGTENAYTKINQIYRYHIEVTGDVLFFMNIRSD